MNRVPYISERRPGYCSHETPLRTGDTGTSEKDSTRTLPKAATTSFALNAGSQPVRASVKDGVSPIWHYGHSAERHKKDRLVGWRAGGFLALDSRDDGMRASGKAAEKDSPVDVSVHRLKLPILAFDCLFS